MQIMRLHGGAERVRIAAYLPELRARGAAYLDDVAPIRLDFVYREYIVV